MAAPLVRFLSSEGGEYDFFALAPEGMGAQEARTLANAIIKETDSAWRNNPDNRAWDASTDDGGIAPVLKGALERAGFVLPEKGLEVVDTDAFDGNHNPMDAQEKQALEAWRAAQAIQAVLKQRAQASGAHVAHAAGLEKPDESDAAKIIVLPSEADAGSEFLALVPHNLSLDDAAQLVEAVIRQKNQEDYDNDGECADGLPVGDSIKAELIRMGFVVENAGLQVKKTIDWDGEHRVTAESEQVLSAWRARQAINKIVEHPEHPARTPATRVKPG